MLGDNVLGMGSVDVTADEVTAELAVVLAPFTALADTVDDVSDGARIERIALLERIKAAVAAAQYAQMVAFARSQVDAQIAEGTLDPKVDPDQRRRVVGHGPIPTGIAKDLLHNTLGKKWWRRLFTLPEGGPLIGADPRRRGFDGVLAGLIAVRDGGRCRDLFCDAPIRHVDHVRPYGAGGPTSLANGRGVCARGNYVRELPGWHVELIDDGLHHRPHTVRTTTPTGHTYTSRAGPAP